MLGVVLPGVLAVDPGVRLGGREHDGAGAGRLVREVLRESDLRQHAGGQLVRTVGVGGDNLGVQHVGEGLSGVQGLKQGSHGLAHGIGRDLRNVRGGIGLLLGAALVGQLPLESILAALTPGGEERAGHQQGQGEGYKSACHRWIHAARAPSKRPPRELCAPGTAPEGGCSRRLDGRRKPRFVSIEGRQMPSPRGPRSGPCCVRDLTHDRDPGQRLGACENARAQRRHPVA